MIYYVILDGFQLIGFDSINLAKYKVIELYQSESLKCKLNLDLGFNILNLNMNFNKFKFCSFEII